MTSRLHRLSAADLLRGYRSRRISPVEATKAMLEQICAKDGAINAMCLVDERATLQSARASERRWLKGSPLSQVDGVPVLVKDIILTKGWPTLRGSRTVDKSQPWTEDGPSVARLREHGAVFIGKTTTPEFGWKGVTDSPLSGVTRNPWDVSKTPGGSSGGSAAAVAAGFAPLALGTDGGGSIRIPAGFTGIFGLKPSFGRVPAYPLSPFGTVAHVGPMTRTVEDAAIMMNVIAKSDARDWHALPYDGRDFTKALAGGVSGLRVAFSPRLGGHKVEAEVAGLVRAAVDALSGLGARVEETDPGFDDPSGIFRVLWWSGARNLLSGLPKRKKALLDPGLADVLEQSMAISLEQYFDAVKGRGALGSRMRLFMQRFDLLVTPCLPIPAFEAGVLAPREDGTGKWVDWTPFTYPFNLSQQPAASVPCGYTKAGLPVGLQIVGRMFDDWTVLRAAHAYERAHEWIKKRPAAAM
jgi:aspartyl-tRNA(Asn)/glutamyl-tRNA(Gln) amidotransferase subunit A